MVVFVFIFFTCHFVFSFLFLFKYLLFFVSLHEMIFICVKLILINSNELSFFLLIYFDSFAHRLHKYLRQYIVLFINVQFKCGMKCEEEIMLHQVIF
jgi:hypothetical protein